MIIKYLFLFIVISTLLTSSFSFFIRNSYDSMLSVKETALSNSTIVQLKKSFIYINGRYYAPLGEDKTDHHELPLNFNGSRVNARGVPYIYCPYSSVSALPANEVITEKTTLNYNITKDNTISANGEYYVTSSENPPVSKLLAIMISAYNKSDLPVCSDVIMDANNVLSLSNQSQYKGKVYGVWDYDLSTINSSAEWYYVTTGSGSNLKKILTTIAQKTEQDAVVVFPSNYTLDIDQNYIISGNSFSKRTIVFKSNQAGIKYSLGSSTNSAIEFKDVNVSFSDLSLLSTTKFDLVNVDAKIDNSILGYTNIKLSNLEFNNVQLGYLSNTNTTATLEQSIIKQSKGSVSIYGSAPTVVLMKDSSWQVVAQNIDMHVGGNSINYELYNSKMLFRDMVLNTPASGSTQQALFYLDEQSDLLLTNVIWNNGATFNYGFYNLGNLSVVNSKLYASNKTTAVIYSEQGSNNKFSQNIIGKSSDKPAIAFLDNFSISLSGKNNDVYAGICSQGGRFDDKLSFTVQDDTVVAALLDGRVIPMTFPENISIDIKRILAPITINCL